MSIRHQLVNILKLSAPSKSRCPPPPPPPILPSYQPGEMKFQTRNTCSSQKMVALWNSRTVKQSSDLTTNPIPHRYHWKSNCQICHLWLFCWYPSFAMCNFFENNSYSKRTTLEHFHEKAWEKTVLTDDVSWPPSVLIGFGSRCVYCTYLVATVNYQSNWKIRVPACRVLRAGRD